MPSSLFQGSLTMYSLSIRCVPFAHRLASHSSVTVCFFVKTAKVLRRSRLTKELCHGMPSTGLCRVVQIRILMISEPLSLQAPVLPCMLILISFVVLQHLLWREPLNEPSSPQIVRTEFFKLAFHAAPHIGCQLSCGVLEAQ